jgi:hypothetical protein
VTATTWPGHTHRRPAASIDQPTQQSQPTVTPAPTQGPAPRDEQWTWTPTDLLLLPIALWLAEGPGQHRRGPDTVTRRGTSYRRTSDFEWSYQAGQDDPR